MNTYIFFTKSGWAEPPRMRHQLANLLRASGNKIIFVQKPIFFWQSKSNMNLVAEDNLVLLTTKQLIHHQLRIYPFLSFLNAIYEKWSINRALSGDLYKEAIVVNFNYDYVFLKNIFSSNKIITVINDDFVAPARFGEGEYAKLALARTCEISDAVLTVSYPLMKQLSQWSKPILFLPWADSPYSSPNKVSKRDAVLIWASINDGIDYDLLSDVSKRLPDILFYIVGPVSGVALKTVPRICAQYKNIIYFPSSSLELLPLDRFFAGLMPYKAGVPSTEAVTLANKSLRLMSKGLPLVVHGMPYFFKHEAIFPCAGIEQMVEKVEYCNSNFFKLQASIENFVSANLPDVRYSAFMEILDQIE